MDIQTSQSVVSQIKVQKSIFEDQLRKGMSLSEDQNEVQLEEQDEEEEEKKQDEQNEDIEVQRSIDDENVEPTTEKKDPLLNDSEMFVDDTSTNKLSTK